MSFALTEQQEMLRDTLRDYLAAQGTSRLLGAADAAAPGPGSPMWKGLAEDMGILGLPFPEERGGLGLGPVETMVVMEELGRGLVNEPVLEGVVVGAALLAHMPADQAEPLIAGIVSGASIPAFAHVEAAARDHRHDVQMTATQSGDGYVLNGAKAIVVGGDRADSFIVSARTGGDRRDATGLSLFLVEGDATGLSRRAYRLLDGRPACDLLLDNVTAVQTIGVPGEAAAIIDEVLDVATAALSAEAVGVMRRLTLDTLEYTQNRRQSGKALAEHQVVQHRIVDMALLAEQGAALAQAAALKIGASAQERAMAVSAAKAFVSKAVKSVGQSAVQLHGGMGMTDEIAIGNLFRRATMIERQLGSADYHLARWEKASLAD